MRVTLTAALLTLLASPLAAQAGNAADTDQAVAGGGAALPAGWAMRVDGKGEAKNVKVAPMGQGLHVTLGPAIILYRESTAGTGPFHTLATFTQTKPSEHPEGYGLFFGGKALAGERQSYTYFLIRQDGSFLVKRRDGAKTSDVSKGWTAHRAIKKPDAKGSATNLLEVDNKIDPSKITFKVNGQDVLSIDAAGVAVDGIVGLRINHNLDVHVEGFDVHR
jgi:hypothetical protein